MAAFPEDAEMTESVIVTVVELVSSRKIRPANVDVSILR